MISLRFSWLRRDDFFVPGLDAYKFGNDLVGEYHKIAEEILAEMIAA
jgi:hypothetical protein